MKTFKYGLYPSRNQTRLLEAILETCRRFYNECLAERKDAYEQEKRTVGKVEQLRKVKVLKATGCPLAPYAAGIHSHVLQVVVADLDKAYQAFFRRVKAGEEPGYPRFKGGNRFDSFGLKEYGNGFKINGRRLKLSGLAPTGKGVGVDVGIASMIVTSDGEKVDNPKWYRAEQAKVRVCQRRVARRTPGGSNRRKAVRLLPGQHERVQNRRKDLLNKLAHKLVNENDAIAIEDLQVKSMVRNQQLSKSSLDAGWGYFRQRLEAKARLEGNRAGRPVVVVPPAYTAKTGSACGVIFEPFPLAERWVECDCGLSLDRDHNAALNILRLGRSRWALTGADTPCVVQAAAGL